MVMISTACLITQMTNTVTLADSPTTLYRSMIENGMLTSDPAQQMVVEQLQKLHSALIQGYQPPSRLRTRLSTLLPGMEVAAPPKGLYIYGGVGRGKSMLMDLFYETAPVAKKKRIHFHAFMQDIHSRIHQWRHEHGDDNDRDPILPIARHIRDHYWLLCLDEFEVHDVADAMILARLFTLLFKRGVILVTTSNRAPRELYPHGLQRERFLKFVDLMEQKIDCIALESATDYRLQKLQALEETYHSPLDGQAPMFAQHSFDSLSNHATPKPYTLHVNNREVIIPKSASGIAWTDFNSLCASALGPKDYICLAEEFHTLILENIPILSAEKRNEARRFVTLIDELYEHRVKLIATAAAPPDQLYPEGDGSFEFHRTVSRLVEMQSTDYLARGHVMKEV